MNKLLLCQIVFLFISRLCLSKIEGPIPTRQQQRHQLQIQPGQINAFLYRSALSALLKLKAEHELKDLPLIEQIIFRQCSHGAKSLPALAKSLVQLLNTKEALKRRKEATMFEDPVSQFGQFLGQLLPPKKTNGTPKFRLKMPKKKILAKNVRKNDIFTEFGRRNARSIFDKFLANKTLVKPMNNVEKLKRIYHYVQMAKHCDAYMARLDQQNTRFMQAQGRRIAMRVNMADDGDGQPDWMDELERLLERIRRFSHLSVLSPQILPLFSNMHKNGSSAGGGRGLLSPTLFSFSGHDGFFSLPDIFRLLAFDQKEALEWLDLLIQMSGQNSRLDRIFTKLAPKMDDLEGHVLPAIQQLNSLEKRWTKATKMATEQQKKALASKGYHFMSSRQSWAIYGEKLAELGADGLVADEESLERWIHRLANLQETIELRKKRQTQTIPGTNPEDQNNAYANAGFIPLGPTNDLLNVQLNVLHPWAFVNQINQGISVEGVFLAPHALFAEIASPELFSAYILSPVAFIPTILSPQLLVSRVLSPGAFRAELLSPEFFSAYVLSPEAFITEILSPKVGEIKVGSGQAMTITVLSPSMLSPDFGSADTMGLVVLTPSILSPRYNSSESFLVEILSPHILGGEHSSTENEEEEHEEDKKAGHEVHSWQHGGNDDVNIIVRNGLGPEVHNPMDQGHQHGGSHEGEENINIVRNG